MKLSGDLQFNLRSRSRSAASNDGCIAPNITCDNRSARKARNICARDQAKQFKSNRSILQIGPLKIYLNLSIIEIRNPRFPVCQTILKTFL